MASGKRRKRAGIAWRTLFFGTLIGVIALIVPVLLLALMLYLEWIPETAISIGNTVIKIVAALAASIFVSFGRERVQWYFGGIAAALSLLIVAAGMYLYLGSFRPTWSVAADCLLCFAVGSAAAAVFAKRKTV